MSNLTFTVDMRKGTSRRTDLLATYFPELLDKAVRRATDFAKRKIIEKTPVKTGAARTSWITGQSGAFEYTIESAIGRGSKYTPFLEFGTGIWKEGGSPIVPKKGKYLVFPIIEGNTIVGWVRTTSVNGMMGHFMVRSTREPTRVKLREDITRAIRNKWEGR